MSKSEAASAGAVGVECIIPILNVANVASSVAFYTRVLGFKTDWDAGAMASVSRDGRAIMFCQDGQGQRGTWVWIGVDDIEPLYADFVTKGASIRLKPTNFPWAYEMQIEDPDGRPAVRIRSQNRSANPGMSSSYSAPAERENETSLSC